MNAIRSFAIGLILTINAAPTSAADLPSAAPEMVGFSAERLARIGAAINSEIE